MAPITTYLYLGVAIIAEVVATSALKLTEGFTRLVPSIAVTAAYAIAFYALTQTLRIMPVGVAYAIWSGLGIVLVAIAARVLYGQVLDLPAILGMVLIIAGCLVINLFSASGGH
jgi:small multidrug resistance pump